MKTHIKHARATSLVALLTTIAAGCGDAEREALREDAKPEIQRVVRPIVDGSVLRGSRDYDYDVKDSVATLVTDSDVALTWTIAGWGPAETSVDHDERSEYAIMKVRVTDVTKGAAKVATGFAYIRLPRGGEVIDAEGNPFRNPGAESTVTSVAEMSAAAPVGTRVVFMGVDVDAVRALSNTADVEVRNQASGHPPGTPVLVPAPQGLLLETAEGDVVSGVADGEPWNWIPQSTPREERFGYLAEALKSAPRT